MSKVRYVDFNPAELLADTAGELTIDEFSLYWMICTLIYSRRAQIDDNLEWIKGKFAKADIRRLRSALDGLVAKGKVVQSCGKLSVNRCETELERAKKRIKTAQENGVNGGRQSNEIKDIQNQAGLSEKSYNQQPLPTTNHHIKKAPDGFGEFWAAYPHKKSRGRAEAAYRKALKHISQQELLEAVKKFPFPADRKFMPHPATWLNDKRWLDGDTLANGALSESSTPWLNL